MHRPTILVVEDSIDTEEAIRVALRSECEIVSVGSAAAARERLDAGGIDLALVDLGLPDGSGFEVCDHVRIKQGDGQLPVVFLTASKDSRDKVTAFQLDAEDYIEKPFDVLELRARIGRHLRRAHDRQARQRMLIAGRVQLDLPALRARFVDGAPLDLTPHEFRLLHVLASQASEVVRREAILEAVWPDVSVTPRTVDTHICNLRKKLADLGAGLEIESVRGEGYRLQVPSE